jgi:MFS transporter, ACS family, hexuronate transporter
MSTNPSAPPERMSNYRWVICALLFFATTINYVDRQILSLIKEILDKELGWTNEQFGMVNSAFQGAYGIGLLVFGWFIDRFGTKIGYAASLAAWSVAAIGHAAVGSVTGFFTARIALGLGEGGNFPSAIKSVALWFPKKERALATSIFNAGTNVGAIIAPWLVPLIAFTWGWRSAFVLAGCGGLIWLFFWIPLYNTPDKITRMNQAERDYIHSDAGEAGDNDAGRVSWLSLLKYRQTWAFIVAKFLTDPIWWFFLIWLPDFFKKTYGLNIKTSWVHIITIYSIVTVLSIFGGWLTGALVKGGWTITRARKTGMFIFALCVVPVFIATNVSAWPAVFLIALAGSAHQAWSANLFTTVSDIFPKHLVASVIGIGGMAGAAGGMLFPIYCGSVLDKFKAAGNEAAAYTQILHLLAFAYIGTFLIHHFLSPKFERVHLDLDVKS